jgi:uncharacterized protein YdeI (BOF family)
MIIAASCGSAITEVAAFPMPLLQVHREPQPDQAQQDPAQLAFFTGTVVERSGEYLLRDSSGQVYKLDDATRAKRFEGKKVEVEGRLDEDAKMIHIESIKDARV